MKKENSYERPDVLLLYGKKISQLVNLSYQHNIFCTLLNGLLALIRTMSYASLQ